MEKNARDIFKSNLIRIMSIRNKKQMDIARDLKIPLTTVNGWIHGTSYPRVTNMQNLADYLKVSMKDLTDDTNKKENVIIMNDKILTDEELTSYASFLCMAEDRGISREKAIEYIKNNALIDMLLLMDKLNNK